METQTSQMHDLKSRIHVRRFVEDDNKNLTDLARSIGVPARIQLGVDRSPKFSTFSQLLSDRWDILVAEENHNIIGFMDMSHVRLRLENKVIPVTYVSLTGVQAKRRGSAVFFRLLEEGEKLARASGSIIVTALININNSRLDRILAKRYKGYLRGEKIVISCIPLGPRYRVDKNFYYDCATQQDLSEITLLVRKEYSSYTMSSVIKDVLLTQYPNFEPKNILVARNHDGKIVASLGLWDQRSFKSIRIIDYKRPEHFLKILLNMSRYFTCFTRIPDLGTNLNLLHSLYTAAAEGYEDGFSGLVRFACNMFAHRNYHFLLLALPESSHLSMACHKLWRITNVNVPIIIPLNRKGQELTHAKRIRRLYFEYALT